MAGFESPITNREAQHALEGLDLQSVLLSRSFEQSSRLNAFIDQYVDPRELTVDIDGEPHTYGHRRVSAIGDEGSLVHIRLHEPHPQLDPSLRHITIISHVDDPQPVSMFPTLASESTRFDGTRLSIFQATATNEAGLQSVDKLMNELQWEVEKVLAAELAQRALPVISVTQNGWEYRRSDRHWEKLHDIYAVRRRVSMALSRGLGYAAVSQRELNSHEEYGQNSKKVVV